MAALEERTSVRAEARYVRTAPRKAQLVAEQIRGRPVPEARTILAFMTRDAARDVERVLSSAVANAEANHGLDGDELVIAAIYADEGPTLKRFQPRARGRVGRIFKRTCHITIKLTPGAPVQARRAKADAVPATSETDAPSAGTAAPAARGRKKKEAVA